MRLEPGRILRYKDHVEIRMYRLYVGTSENLLYFLASALMINVTITALPSAHELMHQSKHQG